MEKNLANNTPAEEAPGGAENLPLEDEASARTQKFLSGDTEGLPKWLQELPFKGQIDYLEDF